MLLDIFKPDFTWHPTRSIEQQERTLSQSSIQPSRHWLFPGLVRRLIGILHEKVLVRVARSYSKYYGIVNDGQICPLPFGLILKRSDGTRLEEVVAMQAARDAGLPVPRVISYGEHPEAPHAPLSILMTRMPGQELTAELWDWFYDDEKAIVIAQLKQFLLTIRRWRRSDLLAREPQICSVTGTAIRSVRVPRHYVGPFCDEASFNQALMVPAYYHATKALDNYEERMSNANELDSMSHDVVFTHGDLAGHNILVLPDGRITALLDWEAAGWYPSYWEFTTAHRFTKPGVWWYDIVAQLTDDDYERAHAADLARWELTLADMY